MKGDALCGPGLNVKENGDHDGVVVENNLLSMLSNSRTV